MLFELLSGCCCPCVEDAAADWMAAGRTRLWAAIWVLGGLGGVATVFWRVFTALGVSSSKLEAAGKMKKKAS